MISLSEVRSSMDFSLRKFSTIFSTHSCKFSHTPLWSLFINNILLWVSNLLMNTIKKLLYFMRDDIYQSFMRFCGELLYGLRKSQLVSFGIIMNVVCKFSIPLLIDFFLAHHLCIPEHILSHITTTDNITIS